MPGTTTFDPARAYSRQLEKRPSIGPIVWAIDPEAINSIELVRMLDFLTVWRGQHGAAIIPVAVVPPFHSYGPLDITAAARQDMDQEARDCIQSALDYLSPNEELKAQVVEASSPGRSTFIQQLLEVAEIHEAEFIAANTHVSPEDHGPFRVGSFCEGLIAQAPRIPIITINPRTQLPNSITKIFVMTDFSYEARELLCLAVGWARHHGAEMVLFHQREEPMLPTNRVDPVFMTTERELAEAAIEHESELWIRYARAKHITCRAIVNEGHATIEGAGLRAAETEKASVIIMGTRMGPVEQRILGSHAREVLVGAKTPVIVLHHETA